MSTAVISLVAMFFLGMGVFGLVAPQALVRPFGIRLDSGEARAEARAVYGGFGVAMAGALACAAMAGGGVRDGVVFAVAAALGGMAFGRLVARAADRPARFYPIWFYFWVEVAAAGALGAAACA